MNRARTFILGEKNKARSKAKAPLSASPSRESSETAPFTLPIFDPYKNETRDVLLDKFDYERIKHYNWYITKSGKGYAYGDRENPIGFRGSMARIILNLSRGDGNEIDHINHDTLDNRRRNLRITDHFGNAENKSKSLKQMGRTRFKGVRPEDSGKFGAFIKVNNKQVWLGSYRIEFAAARAYDSGAIKYFGEYACLNFPKR